MPMRAATQTFGPLLGQTPHRPSVPACARPSGRHRIGSTRGGGDDGAVSLLAIAVVLLLPAVAQAERVSCGQVITRDTVVSNDLVDCPGSGLVIGADGVTLNLGRHVLDGDGSAGGIGIVNGTRPPAGGEIVACDGVTIRNGACGNSTRASAWRRRAPTSSAS
jgi:hypothetical protein